LVNVGDTEADALEVAVALALALKVGVAVCVTVKVGVPVCVTVKVGVPVKVEVPVCVTVKVGVPVRVTVKVGVTVCVAVKVGVPVNVAVRVGVGVLVYVFEGDTEAVWLDVFVGETVDDWTMDAVYVGVLVNVTHAPPDTLKFPASAVPGTFTTWEHTAMPTRKAALKVTVCCQSCVQVVPFAE